MFSSSVRCQKLKSVSKIHPFSYEDQTIKMEEEFDNYMKKVELVENVLKKLGSGDKIVSSLAMKEADNLLHGTVQDVNEDDIRVDKNRSLVNQKAFDEFHKTNDGPETMHPNEFMRQMEADCKERTADRKMRKIESDRHKNTGNKAFREKKYAKALVSYDKAIEALKDSCILYCNRALTYLKLGLPEKALKDAEMSLRANENSLRGFVYKAQALWQLERLEESQQVINEGCQVLPDRKEYFQGLFEEWRTAAEND